MSQQEQVMEQIKKELESLKTAKEIYDYISGMHPSDVYTILSTIVKPKITRSGMGKLINECKATNPDLYAMFKELQMKATASHNHDISTPRMIDVDRAVSKAYSITLRLISEINKRQNEVDDTLIKIEQAINKIEEHLGFEEVTKFDDCKGDVNDDSTNKNEQRIKGDA